MSDSRPNRIRTCQRGLTLIELLVALVMGLVLLAGVATVFLATKETYRVQEAVARVQENGRFALALLTRDLRFGGHRGCSSLKPAGEITNRVPWGTLTPQLPAATSAFANFARPVGGFDRSSSGTWSPALDPHFSNAAASSHPQPCLTTTAGCPPFPSDVFVAMVIEGVPGRVCSHPTPTDPVVIEGLLGLATVADLPGRLVLVSDCEGAALFGITAAAAAGCPAGGTGAALTHGVDLIKQYPSAATAAEVARVHNWAYYVAPSNVTPGEVALWRWDGVGAAEEMVEGVERLEVLFGVDANSDQEVDQYDTAQQVDANDQWPNVISVRIGLLLRSVPGVKDPATQQSLDSDLDGTAEPFSGDSRLRQVFTTTVALRNRMS